MTVFQIKRTPTPGNSPPPNTLFEGELAVDMAEPGGPRLWVGVPASIDPTGQRVVSALGGPQDYVNVAGTQRWNLSVDDADNSFVITDVTKGAPTFRIAPFTNPLLPNLPPASPVMVDTDSNLTIGGTTLYFMNGATNLFASAVDFSITFAGQAFRSISLIRNACSLVDSDNGLPYAIFNETGMILQLQSTATGGVAQEDLTISLDTRPQKWDIIAQGTTSSAPSAFTIADAVTGTRRLNIHPGGTSAPIELLATGELILALDPTSPMGAVTKQYVDSGSLINWSVTEAGAVPGAWTVTDIVNATERLVIEPASGRPVVTATTTFLANGSVSLGGTGIYFGIGGAGTYPLEDLPSIVAAPSQLNFNVGALSGWSSGYYFFDSAGDYMMRVVVAGAVGYEHNALEVIGTLTARLLSITSSTGYIQLGNEKTISLEEVVPGNAYLDVALWPYVIGGSIATAYPAIIIHSNDVVAPTPFQNTYRADRHNFFSRDGLAEYAVIDATGITVGGVPIVMGTEMESVRAEIDRLSARLAALEGGGGGGTPPATPAPQGPAPAPQRPAPTAPVRRPPARR